MKKLLIGVLGVFLVISLFSVSALSGNYTTIDLVQKDPTDWSVVEDGYSGKLAVSQITRPTWEPCDSTWWGFCESYKTFNAFAFYSTNVKPDTDYTLIYYGNEEHNDVWPYATCIDEGTSDSEGKMALWGSLEASMLDDEVEQKIWLVLSNDVDCEAGKMTSWDPTEYLFEYETI